MMRFLARLSNGLTVIFWATTYKSAAQHARNTAAYYKCELLSYDEC